MGNFFFGGGFFVLFYIFFFLILVVFVVAAVRGLLQWNKNNHSPRLTVDASVVAKRYSRQAHHHHNSGHTSYSTSYYATFQVESGDRMEFPLSGSEYGMLVEGDQGKLTFQGTRYLGFQRGVSFGVPL